MFLPSLRLIVDEILTSSSEVRYLHGKISMLAIGALSTKSAPPLFRSLKGSEAHVSMVKAHVVHNRFLQSNAEAVVRGMTNSNDSQKQWRET